MGVSRTVMPGSQMIREEEEEEEEEKDEEEKEEEEGGTGYGSGGDAGHGCIGKRRGYRV